MKLLFVIALTLLLSACAAVSEQEREENRYKQIDWENRYLAYVNRCHRAGGRMIITKYSRVGNRDIPRKMEPFDCTSNIGRQPRPD